MSCLKVLACLAVIGLGILPAAPVASVTAAAPHSATGGRPSITKVDPGVGSASISWSAGGRDYRVQMKQSGGPWQVAIAQTRLRQGTVSGLDPANRYRFRVAAKRGSSWVSGGPSGWIRPLGTASSQPGSGSGSPGSGSPGAGPPGSGSGPPASDPPASDPPTVPAGGQIWVDAALGSDSNPGTQTLPVATITEAWNRVPAREPLSQSVRISVRAGNYPEGTSPNYWESRWGTAVAPIIFEAVDGPHTVQLRGDMNVFDVRYLWIQGIDIIRAGDAFHCEQCSHLTINEVEFDGGGAAHETIKVNQSNHVDILDSDIHGSYENAIDFVAVQYGTISDNKIHAGDDWCAYVKGGSAYITVTGNEIYDCGTGGFTAGQGTGFEFMVAPWLRYEAYGITVTDNIIHDTWGAGLGVNGGYNVVMAFNSLYRIGTRSHTVEFVHGARGCDGDLAKCAQYLGAGGWGAIDGGGQWIPNRHVYFMNNIVFNPPGIQTAWQHFTVAGPIAAPIRSGVPSPSLADDDLIIRGNIVSNGSPAMDTGIADPAKRADLLATNWINTLAPQLVDPAHGDFRPAPGGNVAALPSAPIPALAWSDSGVPDGGSPYTNTARPPGARR